MYYYNPNRIEPPDDPEPLMECPVCGALLWAGDHVYRTGMGEIFACEHCIDELADELEEEE